MRFATLVWITLATAVAWPCETSCLAASAKETSATEPAGTLEKVPFVGCASGGQQDLAAPSDDGKSPMLPAWQAQALAYYANSDLAVLAPRGWHCFGIQVAAGSGIIVSPEIHDARDLFRDATRFKGPIVSMGIDLGETEGRFEVAQAVARLFPAHRDFVRRIVAEGFWPARDFPSAPYPHDLVTRKGPGEIEFVTPPHRQGRGTEGRITPNGDPVHGRVILLNAETTFELLEIEVRLPSDKDSLVSVIMDQAGQAPMSAGDSP